METKETAEHILKKGNEYFEIENYLDAEVCFKKLYLFPKYKNVALIKLVDIKLKEGRYNEARKLLENNNTENNPYFFKRYALLEKSEYNFSSCKKYYETSLDNFDSNNKVYFHIARSYIQLGEYEKARNILERLKLNDKFYYDASFELICLDIIEKKYENAYNMIYNINDNNFEISNYIGLDILRMYILYFLGEIKKYKNCYDPIKSYMIYRLYDNSDDIIINHISDHITQSNNKDFGCFFKDINFKSLLYDVRDRIIDLNPIYSNLVDKYNIKLDYPIGYMSDFITNDICIVTITTTHEIITAYPIVLSDRYDIEHMANSKELKLKRNNRGNINEK